jgi:hypothetical protein
LPFHPVNPVNPVNPVHEARSWDSIFHDMFLKNEVIHTMLKRVSKSMAKCKINIYTDFTYYTDFHNHY